MSDLLKLRGYQEEAITYILGAISDKANRPAVVLPTGAGKTVIFSHLANLWHMACPGKRVLILVHRDELIRQTVNKFNAIAPALRVGVIKAERDEHTDVDVIVASVQSLASTARRERITDISLVIVDEAHHAGAPTYRTILSHFGCMDGKIPAVGFSATLYRADGGLGDIWERVVYQQDILDMIRPGYLTDVRGKLVTVDGLSLQKVARRNGDLAPGSLTAALMSSPAVDAVYQAYIAHAKDRKTIIFTPSVAASSVFYEYFQSKNIHTGMVLGNMTDLERRAQLRMFANGDIDVMINCMVLTEGFDEPSASCAIIARPTQSASLYIQMVGRVLRPYPGKTDALILDVVGATQDHKLASLVDLTTRRINSIQSGESLLEAVVRERDSGNPELANYVINTRDVDLFHRSRSAWLQTHSGIWFIQTRCPNAPKSKNDRVTPRRDGPNLCWFSEPWCNGHIFFVWPDDDGQYKLGVRSSTYGAKKGYFVRKGLSLELAMDWAEQMAEEADPSTSNRDASWRKKKDNPSDAQISHANRRGIKVSPGTTRKELSDMISVDVVSEIFK